MTYSLHHGAERDIADAMDYYSEHAGSAVAVRFLQEFERVANLLVDHPRQSRPANPSSRQRCRLLSKQCGNDWGRRELLRPRFPGR